MLHLVDTNVLARALDSRHSDRRTANDAVTLLVDGGHKLVVVPQVLFEWWAVATRPRAVNGLGMHASHADSVLKSFEARFPVLPDDSRLYSAWRRMVVEHGVSGKTSHDARLAAAMEIHGIAHLLTFNAADFVRFPHVTVVTPHEVLAT